MSDTQMIEFIIASGAQVRKDRFGNWTVQVMQPGQLPIQPTRATLRAAITDAHNEWIDMSFDPPYRVDKCTGPRLTDFTQGQTYHT
jgi:hypothetical protein